VGACLDRGGADVTLIARGEHLRAMAENGVQVRSPLGDFQSHPAATSELDAIDEADVVFLGLKAYSLPELAPAVGRLMRPDAVVIAAQNGIPWWYFQRLGGRLDGRRLESVDPRGAVSAAFTPDQVAGCVVYCATEIAAPGVIRHFEGMRFSIGTPSGEQDDRCREITAAFRAGGLRAPFARDLRSQIWLKLIGNAALNPLTTVTRSTLGGLAASPQAVGIAKRVMEECAAVAAALDVELPLSVERRLEAALEVGDHKTSMLQDWEAGKRLETDCLTGAVVEIADMVGVPVPETRVLHSLTLAVEELRGSA
jgi:2-dehydropantoate 2-reductase